MKNLHTLACAALAMSAALTACSNEEFNAEQTANDRKDAFVKSWIKAFDVPAPDQDWCMLKAVDLQIAPTGADNVTTYIYNANPSNGGHLLGYAKGAAEMTVDVSKTATSIYGVMVDAEGGQISAGLYTLGNEKTAIDGNPAPDNGLSRYAHPTSWFDAMIVCEDLGATSASDFDFNDIVIGLRLIKGSNKLKITPMAAGGTLEAKVLFDGEVKGEIHNMLVPGTATTQMLQTMTHDAFKAPGVTVVIDVPYGWTISRNWKDISLRVTSKGSAYDITGPATGDVPQMICLGGDWFWPVERKNIQTAYPGFKAWASGNGKTGAYKGDINEWASDYSSEQDVVAWNIDQVTTNWFSGVTYNEGDYTATINSSTYNVASGEIFGLEPPTTTANMFSNRTSLISLDLDESHFDVSEVTNMNSMFFHCTGLTELDLSGWKTSKVTHMGDMFKDCTSLERLNLSGWETPSLTNLSRIFQGCNSLESLDLSRWDFSHCTSSGAMSYMFDGCTSLTKLAMRECIIGSANIQISSLPTSVTELDLRGWDIKDRTTCPQFHNTSLVDVDVTDWKTSGVTSTAAAFSNCTSITSLKGVEGWDMSAVTTMNSMFTHCSGLTELDLSDWNTANVSDMGDLFKDCTSLTSLNIANWDTPKLTSISRMFQGCTNLTEIDLSGWNLSGCTSSGATNYMFGGCTSLEKLKMENCVIGNANIPISSLGTSCTELDFKGWDIRNRTACPQFYNSNIVTVDVTGWLTRGVTSMASAFSGCSSITSLTGVEDWDMSAVTTMNAMFWNCKGLETLDLSDWSTPSLEITGDMFKDCTNLRWLDLSTWDTSHLTSMGRMFQSCTSLEYLDLRGWDLSSVTSCNYAFQHCPENLKIRCSAATKQFLLDHKSTLHLPAALQDAGNGNWIIE